MAEIKQSEWSESQSVRAIHAKYDVRRKLIHVGLQNGASFSFPPHLAQGLQNASPAQLALIEISPMGTGLSWPLLDADLLVEGLLHGIFGSRAWLRAHAAKAGSSRSQAKANAARINGSRGGRPRKSAEATLKV
jgi:hypothetical protein